MIEELSIRDMTVREFLDDLRDLKGYTSIICSFTDEYLPDHNSMLFYDGDVLEYQVGTSKIVKATVDREQLSVKKDGLEYRGDKAAALFKNDREFKLWKRTCDGEKNALITNAGAGIQVYHVNHVYALKELQLPQDLIFFTVKELMNFILSRDFEAIQARYLPYKKV